jgi:outer membrane protein insertion porin family
MKHGYLILWLLMLSMLVGVSVCASAQEAEQPIIRDIAFTGFVHLGAEDQGQVQQAISSQVGQPFAKEAADADVVAILELGWFFRAEYRTETMEGGGVRLIFQLVENPVVGEVTFDGNTVISTEDLNKAVRTKAGSVLNREQVTADALRIKEVYAKAGYTLVEVTNINISPEGKLVFSLFEPRVDEIRIEGNTKTKDEVVRRELHVRNGQVYNIKDLHTSLRNLEELGIFQEVTVMPEPGTKPGTLLVTFRVQEKRTGLAAFGVGHSNIDGVIGFIDVSDANLFGTGQRGSLRYQFGGDTSYQLSYTNPYIDRRRTSMTLNLYDRELSRQVVQGNSSQYDERRKGANISFGRKFRQDEEVVTRGFVTFRSENVKGVPGEDGTLPVGLESPYDMRSVTLSAVRDEFDPSKGTAFKRAYYGATAEVAGFGGVAFNKFTVEGRRYLALREIKPKHEAQKPMHWVYATRLMVGTCTGSPKPLDQFLVGGADSLRGYAEDRFPGMHMVLWNNELRVPFTDALQGVLFVDVGDGWGGSFADQYGDQSFKLHTGYGLGIRIQTPIGPLRLDYGLGGDGSKEFHFGMGSTY